MISEIFSSDDDSLTVCDVIWQLDASAEKWELGGTGETDDPEEEDRPLLGAWVCTLNPDPDAPVINSGAKKIIFIGTKERGS